MRTVDLVAIQFDPAAGVSVLVLRERDEPHRMLPIFVGGAEGASIALAAQGVQPPRPMTHDLMATLVANLDGHLDGVEVTELRDGSFVAELAMSGPTGQHRVDTRPSDAIALALRLGAPVYVSDEVMDEAGAVPEADEATDAASESEAAAGGVQIDPALIDAELDAFRDFLADVDPADFLDRPSPDDPDDGDERGPGDGATGGTIG